MRFSMKHLINTSGPVEFDDNNPPDWLVHEENKWFWDRHVLNLKVGQSIDTDFQTITRIE